MRLSDRVGWDLRPNALTQLIEERRRSRLPVLDLTESNPTRAALSYPDREILAALSDPRVLRYEPTPRGSPEAREAVAAYYRGRGVAVDADRILLTASTSEAYAWAFKLLCNPGDEVLVPAPSYPLFEYLAALESVRPVPYPLAYHDGWEIDVEALGAAARPRARAVVVVNPNNPTGSFLKRRELEALRALGLAVIADEVFGDYAFGRDLERVDTLAGESALPVLVLSGLSKAAGLPQMKLGWMVVTGPGAEGLLERLEVVADTYLSVGTPIQVAAPALLALAPGIRDAIGVRTRENLESLRAALVPPAPLSLLRVEGGWYATLRLPQTRSEEDWTLSLLAERGVLVHPGHFFDFPTEAYWVLSLLTPPQVFREGVHRLLEHVTTRDA